MQRATTRRRRICPNSSLVLRRQRQRRLPLLLVQLSRLSMGPQLLRQLRLQRRSLARLGQMERRSSVECDLVINWSMPPLILLVRLLRLPRLRPLLWRHHLALRVYQRLPSNTLLSLVVVRQLKRLVHLRRPLLHRLHPLGHQLPCRPLQAHHLLAALHRPRSPQAPHTTFILHHCLSRFQSLTTRLSPRQMATSTVRSFTIIRKGQSRIKLLQHTTCLRRRVMGLRELLAISRTLDHQCIRHLITLCPRHRARRLLQLLE